MGKRKEEKKRLKKKAQFFYIEGHILNEKTGILEPYKKKVYWYPVGRCGT